CSLSFEAEPEEEDIMRRKPRAPDSPLVSRSLLAWAGIQGALALALAGLLALATWANLSDMSEEVIRSTCFAGLVAAVLALIFANRSFEIAAIDRRRGHNLPLAIIMTAIVTVFALV